jgi:hypothetical protein
MGGLAGGSVIGLLVVSLVGAAPALAQDGLPSTGFVEVYPVADVVGDGATPVTVHVLALRPDGSPMDDLAVKLKSADATGVGGWKHEGAGLYSFQLTPPRVDVPGRTSVRVRGKTADKAFKVDVTATVPLVPGPPTALTVSANPAELLSGERDEATITFRVAGMEAIDPANLLVRTSLGEVGDIADMGAGRYVARLDVQKVRDPGLALVTVADARFPDRLYATLTIPVTVKREMKVKAPKGSSVLLRVGDREFGPADAKAGQAVVRDVVLPPGVATLTQVTVVDGTPSESAVDLGLPASRRLAIVPPPRTIPADPGLVVPLRIAVVGPDGRPDGAATLSVTTDAGEAAAAVHEGAGIYRVDLRPAAGAVARAAKFVVEIAGEKGQRDEVALALAGRRAAALTVAASPDPLAGAREATLTATVLASDGTAIAGRAVDWNLTGAKAAAPASVAPDGAALQRIQTFGGPVEVYATALTPPGANPPRSLVIVPSRTWLPGDAISSARLLVIALDAFGYPVVGAKFRVQVESGNGAVPAEVVTDERGLGEIFYTAGQGTRFVRLRVYQPGVSAVTTLLQGAAELQRVTPPVSGTEAMRAEAEAWRRIATSRRIEP